MSQFEERSDGRPEQAPITRQRMIGFVAASFVLEDNALPADNDLEPGRWYEQPHSLNTNGVDDPNRVDVFTMKDEELVNYFQIAYILDGRLPEGPGRLYEAGAYRLATKTLQLVDNGELFPPEFSVFVADGRKLDMDDPGAYIGRQITLLNNARDSKLLMPIE